MSTKNERINKIFNCLMDYLSEKYGVETFFDKKTVFNGMLLLEEKNLFDFGLTKAINAKIETDSEINDICREIAIKFEKVNHLLVNSSLKTNYS